MTRFLKLIVLLSTYCGSLQASDISAREARWLASPQVVMPAATPTCPPEGSPGPWIKGNPYPELIADSGFAQTSTHFYVFAGEALISGIVNRMEIATGVWEALAPMPSNAESPTCALMEATGVIYCGFGRLRQGFAAYNIATNTWTSLAPVPTTDSYGSALGAFNGKVFLVGGTSQLSSGVWIYDVATDTWSAGTSAPSEVWFPGHQQIGEFLYVVGGWDSFSPGRNKKTTWRLDMSSAPGAWENGPIFSPARADFGLTYDPGTDSLYALGGDTRGDDFNDQTAEVDQLALGDWPNGGWITSRPHLPAPPRQSNLAGYGAGEIWSIGGYDPGQEHLDEVWHRRNTCPDVSPTPTATPTPSFTPTPSASPTPTATFTPTPTSTVSSTVTPSPTPAPTARATPVPRPRPSPTPRP